SRIALLTTNDVILQDGTVLLRIGDPPTPAPEPLADLLRELLAHRTSFRGPNAHTAWLFPGRRAGQPMRSQALGALQHQYGIAVQAGRTAALRQLVLQTPAPVIASMLGYHNTHTAWLVAEAGGTWSRYAPGDDHKQCQSPRTVETSVVVMLNGVGWSCGARTCGGAGLGLPAFPA
ncbi:MAG: hypothetical protein ACRDRP_26155, partial [Pseudonocardiaceae bacterium]